MDLQRDEHEIEAAYGRLGTALAPPVDTVQRVEHRVAVRRRRRRTTVAGGTLLAVVAVGGVTFAALSGDDGSGQSVAVDPPSGLTMTRADGTTYTFGDIDVTCDGAQRIHASSTRVIVDDLPTQPFLTFDGIVDEIAGDQTFTFPTDWNMRSDRFPLVLFAMDTDGNETASSAGGESGTVRVVEAACDPMPVLRLEVDMTLGSEEGRTPLRVTGSLR